jgi:amidase
MWKSSIDTLGHFARSLDDIALMRRVLTGDRPAPLNMAKDVTPRIGICRTKLWAEAGPENIAMIDKVSAILRDAGAVVDDVGFPVNFDEIIQAHPIITGADSLSVLPAEITGQLEKVNSWTRDRTRDAQNRPAAEIEEARRIAAQTRVELKEVFQDFDLLLTPAAEGEAQTDPAAMPPPSFNSLWTLMYTPCVSLPVFTGPNDMPVGLQIVGAPGRDDFLLALSVWVEKTIIDATGGLPASL